MFPSYQHRYTSSCPFQRDETCAYDRISLPIQLLTSWFDVFKKGNQSGLAWPNQAGELLKEGQVSRDLLLLDCRKRTTMSLAAYLKGCLRDTRDVSRQQLVWKRGLSHTTTRNRILPTNWMSLENRHWGPDENHSSNWHFGYSLERPEQRIHDQKTCCTVESGYSVWQVQASE